MTAIPMLIVPPLAAASTSDRRILAWVGRPRAMRLLARLRHRQLETARRGDFRASARYARWAARIRRTLYGPGFPSP
jgi:hypothetical protein